MTEKEKDIIRVLVEFYGWQVTRAQFDVEKYSYHYPESMRIDDVADIAYVLSTGTIQEWRFGNL